MGNVEESNLAWAIRGSPIKTVYIAGPLTPTSITQNHAIEYLTNMRNMVVVARKLLMAGYYPFVPAFDFLFFMIPPEEEEISAPQIKEYSMEWLRRCDAILLLPGWFKSPGSIAEFHEALDMGIPIFLSVEDLLSGVPNAIS